MYRTIRSSAIAFLVLVVMFWPIVVLAVGSHLVVGIKDGDTIVVLSQFPNNKHEVTIRFYGIDCPERGQPFSSAAKKYVSKRVYLKRIVLIPHGKDRYGRTIAEVITPDGNNLGEELVSHGLCFWYRYFAPNNKRLEAAERSAKMSRRGVWSFNGLVERPWAYRKKKREKFRLRVTP